MKGEQEFLDGMWQKVSILEREELEKTRVKVQNLKLTKKVIYNAVIGIFVFSILLLLSKYIYEAIYPVTIGILVVAFICESLSNRFLREDSYANYNFKLK